MVDVIVRRELVVLAHLEQLQRVAALTIHACEGQIRTMHAGEQEVLAQDHRPARDRQQREDAADNPASQVAMFQAILQAGRKERFKRRHDGKRGC